MPAPAPGPQASDLWAIVPAGGAGTRLWPLSRAGSPKFLHDLTGTGRSLLQQTADRLGPLAGDRLLVVTGVAHEDAVRAQVSDDVTVLAEPSPRDSMAAIGWAAAIVERSDPDAVVASFAADHVIDDDAAFAHCVAEAVEVAASTDLLVTLGIAPTTPATGFGYIRLGEPLPGRRSERRTARRVVEFVEKPDAERATSYLASGEYRWNAGMFVVRAGVLLDLLAEHHPDLAAGVRALAAEPERLGEIWPSLERIAIDHAVAEPAAVAGRVAVVPADFGWDDVGDFAALSDLVAPPRGSDDGVRVLGDPALVTAVDSDGLVVPGGGRQVAVVGLRGIVVIDTGDALLVTDRAHAQDVKAVVARLKETGRDDLT